jgi:O-antigen/teichoic acid export membrane protein
LNLRKVLGNMSAAAIAQMVSLVVSLCTSLLAPKVLGVTEFGYWQLFIFYFNYVGAFQLGLNDGVYLIKGGQSRKDLDRSEITSECLFGLFFQTLMALAVVVFTIVMQPEPQRLFVIIACAILMPLYNAACFFQYLLQAIDETRTYSASIIIDRGIMMILLILLLALRVDAFEIYVYAFCLGKVLQLVYLFIKARGVLTRSLLAFREAADVSWESMRVGIKLMIANLASTLILGMMRFTIDGYWGIETFSKVSLALSMANLFLTFVTQVTMVLFPTLRQMDERLIKTFFGTVQNALEILLPAILLLYLPVKLVLSWWLPAYVESFNYLGLLLPLCLFDGKMNALYSTMFKVRRMERTLLVLNVATMALSALLATFGALVIHDLNFVLVSGALSIILRSTLSCAILSCDVLGKVRIRVGEIVLSIIFIANTILLSDIASLLIYLTAYMVYLFTERKSVARFCGNVDHVRNLLNKEKSE